MEFAESNTSSQLRKPSFRLRAFFPFLKLLVREQRVGGFEYRRPDHHKFLSSNALPITGRHYRIRGRCAPT